LGASSIDEGIGSDAGGETDVDLTPDIGVDSTFIAGCGRRTGVPGAAGRGEDGGEQRSDAPDGCRTGTHR
jgi:hypothetical protein